VIPESGFKKAANPEGVTAGCPVPSDHISSLISDMRSPSKDSQSGPILQLEES